MQNPNPIRRRPKPTPRPSEEGYLLLAVMFLLFLVALSVTVGAPRMAREIQQDRDRETMERGKQYIRAVQLYYRKFHAYPPSADALVKTNEIRFLRKRYTDPITGKDDWKPILFGQNKVPIAMGFFGQPLASSASSMAGMGPSGGNGMNGVNGNATGGAFNTQGGSGGSIFNSSGADSSAATPAAGSTDSSNGDSSSGGSSAGGSSTASGAGSTGSTAAGTAGSGTTGQPGQSFGGAGVIGFEPGSSKQSMLVWKKKDHYNEWEFTYDPIMDMRTASGGNTGAIGQPASGMSSPVGTTPGSTTSPGIGSGSGSSQPSTTSSPQ